jgi:hypothetical protein
MYKDFPEAIHPKIRGTDCGLALLLWTIALLLLFGIFYVMFIIFQLALYNIIMGVVMAVFWWRLTGVSTSVVKRFLDNKRKSQYKAYFRRVKEMECFAKLNIEIQEHEEGLWIEIHLSETIDDDKEDDLDDSDDVMVEGVVD